MPFRRDKEGSGKGAESAPLQVRGAQPRCTAPTNARRSLAPQPRQLQRLQLPPPLAACRRSTCLSQYPWPLQVKGSDLLIRFFESEWFDCFIALT